MHRKAFARDLILSMPCRKAAPQGRAVSKLAYACGDPCCCELSPCRAQAPDERRCLPPRANLNSGRPSAVTVLHDQEALTEFRGFQLVMLA